MLRARFAEGAHPVATSREPASGRPAHSRTANHVKDSERPDKRLLVARPLQKVLWRLVAEQVHDEVNRALAVGNDGMQIAPARMDPVHLHNSKDVYELFDVYAPT